jgi:sialate O-acetylesterase
MGRAIQLGYITNVNTSVVDYLKDVDPSKLVRGATRLKIAQCLNMHSGIRISEQKAKTVMRDLDKLKGQGQVEAILTHSAPVTRPAKTYKYQGTDPSIVMQVIEAVVPGSAEDFIELEVLGKLGITTYVWQPDVSGLPKSAAGSSMRSRDMLKFGMVIADGGKWQGEQLWPAQYIREAVGPLYTNKVGKMHHCISARGAGGQFIMIIPTMDLIVVATSHNRDGGMRHPLKFTEQQILPGFVGTKVRAVRIVVASSATPVLGAAPSESAAAKPAATKPAVPAAPVAMPLGIAERAMKTGLEMSRLFGDHMILQQKTSNAIWGWARPGQIVTVNASWGETASAKANKDGRWQVQLKTPGFGTGFNLRVSGGRTIDIKEVAIGEVWLCAGQSNMGWAMGNSFEAEGEAANATAPNFRIFRSSREHWHQPLRASRDLLAKWSPCTPETAAATSAVSYYFGRKLHEALGVPVGIIQQAYAGTPIEGWLPKETQADDARVDEAMATMDAAKQRLSRDDALKKFAQELVDYNALIASGETMLNAVKELKVPFITQPSNMGHQYPSHIFNAMIHPVRPYGIRGMIWYQGERNSKNPAQAVHYRNQLPLLIRYYRSSWHEMSDGNVADDFPFYFTQLPSWTPAQVKPAEGDEAPWAINREMMRLVSHEVNNTAMAVSIDTGDEIALHPKNKKPIGLRHARLALAGVYGKDIVATGPVYRGQKIDGSKMTLTFDSIGSGLMAARSGEPLNAFAVAGGDKVWHWADAEIQGDTIVVSSKDVPKPLAVRYAWAMNPSKRNLLYNKEGLPASPFRTDDWPLVNGVYEGRATSYQKPASPAGYEPSDWDRPQMKW